MKARSIMPALLVVLAMFLLLNSCKTNDSNDTNPESSSMRTKEIYPLASVAPELYEQINDPYEEYGKFVYHHFKFNPVDDPIEYIPKHRRASYIKVMEDVEKENEGLSFRQRLDKMRQAKLINDNIYLLYSNYFEELTIDVDQAASPVELWKVLRKKEKQLMNRSNEAGVENLLVSSSIFRNYIRYQWEVDEFTKQATKNNLSTSIARQSGEYAVQQTQDFCLFGLKGSCWVNNITQAVFDGAVAGLGKGLSNAANDKAFWSGVSNTGYVGAAISFIKSTFGSYRNSTCGCGSSAPATCATPTGFRLLIENCTLSQYFQVMGGGTSPTNFHYTVANGTLPEYGNICCVQNAGAKMIKVTQTNPGTPIMITVTVNCGNGTTYAYTNSYDLYAITRNPEPVSIGSGSGIPYGSSWAYEYNVLTGEPAANKNNTYSWSRNWAGQTVGGGAINDNFIRIVWTGPQGPNGWVYLNSQNACSGAVAYKSLNVTIY